MRTGLIAQKLGMTRDLHRGRQPCAGDGAAGRQLPGRRACARPRSDGYTALQLGVGTAKVKNVTKPQRGHFAQGQGRAQGAARRIPRLRRCAGRGRRRDHRGAFRRRASMSTSSAPASARALPAAMKRHNFGGLRATHGVSVSHRSHGSTGQRQSPGKTFKNKKMAGHLGAERVTMQSLEVVVRRCRARRLDAEGRGARQQRRLCPGQGRGQAQGAGRAAVPGRAACDRRRAAAAEPVAEMPEAAETECPRESRVEQTRRPQSRQPGGRRHRARRRGVRAAGAPRHPGARRQLAARQAPRRHPQDQGHQRHPGHHQKAVQAEGHRPRPPGQPALAAIPRRRGDLRPGRAQPRIRPAEKGAPARPQDRAVGQAGRGQARRHRRRPRRRGQDQGVARPARSAGLGVGADHRRAGGRREFRPRRPQPAARRRAAAARAPTFTTSCAATRWS